MADALVKHYTRKHISLKCVLKVDHQESYDSVDWIYIEQLMMGVGSQEKILLGYAKALCQDSQLFNHHHWRTN